MLALILDGIVDRKSLLHGYYLEQGEQEIWKGVELGVEIQALLDDGNKYIDG